MTDIPVADLSPGEAVLSQDDVARHRAAFDSGDVVQPVEILEDEGKKIVRDGNNRVRAYVEHCRSKSVEVGSIACITSKAPKPGPAALDGLRKMSRHYGSGPSAFEAMPLAPRDQYESMQTEVARRIYREEMND